MKFLFNSPSFVVQKLIYNAYIYNAYYVQSSRCAACPLITHILTFCQTGVWRTHRRSLPLRLMPSNYSVTCTVECRVQVNINKLVSAKYLAGFSFENHAS
jgi:hypothetical protein